MVLISASMLSSDLSNLEKESKILLQNNIDFLHMDIMDGIFVNNLTFGYPVLKSLKNNIPLAKLDCHLMVTDPIKIIDPYLSLAFMISFHIEACPDYDYINNLIKKIKNKKILVGIAIKSSTNLNFLEKIINKIDYVLLMSVEPGFSGQKFIKSSLERIKYIRNKFPNIIIQVDGGINLDNCKNIIDAGADILVSGSTIFNSSNKNYIIKKLKNHL